MLRAPSRGWQQTQTLASFTTIARKPTSQLIEPKPKPTSLGFGVSKELNKENTVQSSGAIFLSIYLGFFTLALAGLILIPNEREGLRTVAGIIVYGTGLPIFVAWMLTICVRKGWLLLDKKGRTEKSNDD